MQTMQEVIIGLFFAILIGTSIAILMDVIPLFRILINPLLVISQTIPIVVLTVGIYYLVLDMECYRK